MFKMPMLCHLRVLLNKGVLYEEILVYPYNFSRYLRFLLHVVGSQGVSTKTIKENKKIVVATESEFCTI